MNTSQRVSSSGKPHGIIRYLPILGWLPRYQRAWLRGDVIAGLTVLALLIPEGMAYAEIAGLPPQTAFYAAPIGLALYAIFGTSRQLVVAVSAAIATMSAVAVAPLAAAGSPEYAAYSAGLALLAGLISLLAGLFKLGRIASFFSESVLTGFVTGLALTIAIKQVPKLFGFEAGQGNFWERLADIVRHLPETHLLTLLIGVLFVALIFFLEHRFHRVPAALVALILGIGLSLVFGLEARGVHVVGAVPAGLAPPKLPALDLGDWLLLVPGALGIALVNFAEAYGPARSFAARHGYQIDPDQELIGLGAANMGAGLFQGFSIGSSLSKSAANDRAGAQTPMALIVCAVLTIVVALFFTPFFAPLPEAVLAAVVVVAVTGMMKFAKIRHLYAVRRPDFWLAIIALFGVLTFEALEGLLIAVIASLLALVWRASQARLDELQPRQGRVDFTPVGAPDVPTRPVPGMLVLRPDEGIFFANAGALHEAILAAASTEPLPQFVLLDIEMTYDLDAPGAEMLGELHEALAQRGARLALARVHPDVEGVLARSGALEKIGAAHLYPRAFDALLDHLALTGSGAEVRQVVQDGITGIVALLRQRMTAGDAEQQAQLAGAIDQLEDLRTRLETTA